MKPIDMTKVYENYKGKWVAMKSPTDVTVVAAAKTLKETMEKARKKGFDHPVVTQIPKRVLPIIGVI